MSYRWRPKNAVVDPDNPRAWGQCDRCGMIWPQHTLQWQYAYMGSTMPQNTRMLVCSKHVDPLNIQDAAYILPPDPPPVLNARAGASDFNEGSWLVTDDQEILTTQDGSYIGTGIPSPDDAANDSQITFAPTASDGPAVIAALLTNATAYFDLFNGNPLTTGTSVLATITGSATRANLASSLSLYRTNTRIINTSRIIIAAAAAAQVNVNYAAFYTAASGGALIISGPVGLSQTVADGNPVTVAATGIDIQVG